MLQMLSGPTLFRLMVTVTTEDARSVDVDTHIRLAGGQSYAPYIDSDFLTRMSEYLGSLDSDVFHEFTSSIISVSNFIFHASSISSILISSLYFLVLP